MPSAVRPAGPEAHHRRRDDQVPRSRTPSYPWPIRRNRDEELRDAQTTPDGEKRDRSHNAAAESFHSSIKVEYIHRHRFATRAGARLKIATWITDFFNTRRRHSAAGGLPPVEFERTITEARMRAHQEDRAA
ncbi:integrase core domain-containing protein [Streptomyces sp. WZ-12]|uniref:integrase core domain-containing protein n=1 Tax=Streptomyces sp. WZ-12 TaxID=3030210 RepID=UPI00406D1BC2